MGSSDEEISLGPGKAMLRFLLCYTFIAFLPSVQQHETGQEHFPVSQEHYLGKLMKDSEMFSCHGNGDRREGGRGGKSQNLNGRIFQTSNRKTLFPQLLQYIIPETRPLLVMGSAFASGSVLELAGSVGQEGNFYQLVTEATLQTHCCQIIARQTYCMCRPAPAAVAWDGTTGGQEILEE